VNSEIVEEEPMSTAHARKNDARLDEDAFSLEEPTSSAIPRIPIHLSAPLSEAAAARQIAIRSDEVVLLSTEDLEGCDLSGRKIWTAIELTHAEVAEVRQRIMGTAAEAAAHLAGSIRNSNRKKGGGS
jgi:hypothetical protein